MTLIGEMPQGAEIAHKAWMAEMALMALTSVVAWLTHRTHSPGLTWVRSSI